MQNTLAFLLVIIGFFVGIILLQIFLSKRKSKWLGLILPGISAISSIIGVLGMAFFGNESTIEVIVSLVMTFLLLNIPTMILLAIYFACREKMKKNKEIDKMNIQDL